MNKWGTTTCSSNECWCSNVFYIVVAYSVTLSWLADNSMVQNIYTERKIQQEQTPKTNQQ